MAVDLLQPHQGGPGGTDDLGGASQVEDAVEPDAVVDVERRDPQQHPNGLAGARETRRRSPGGPVGSLSTTSRGAPPRGVLEEGDGHDDRDKPGGRARRARRAVPHRAAVHRGAGRAALGRGPDRADDARRQPDEVASGAHDLVLRDLRAGAARAGLRRGRSGLRLPVQLVLRGGRAPARPPAAGLPHPPRHRRDRRLPARRRRSGRRPAGRGDHARGGRSGRARPAPRAAAPGAAAHGHQARPRHQPAAPGLRPGRGAPRPRRRRVRHLRRARTVRGADHAGLDRAPGRHRPRRPRRRRVRLRQRGPPSRRPAAPVRR